jgi:hypothetical protein
VSKQQYKTNSDINTTDTDSSFLLSFTHCEQHKHHTKKKQEKKLTVLNTIVVPMDYETQNRTTQPQMKHISDKM